MKHTPGPWEVEVDKSGEVTVYEAVTRENIDICTMGGNTNDGSNGRLVASAPDLLEALKVASKAIREYRNQGAPTAYWDDVEAQANAAIAKAENA
jgi:ABC-type Fe3+-hydroxamate transport system substrate-binding protein